MLDYRKARLSASAIRRCLRPGRPHQGDQERRRKWNWSGAPPRCRTAPCARRFAAVKPGMRDAEVAAAAQYYSQCHGSENGIYLCASMPLGSAVEIRPAACAEPRHPERRPDRLLVEDNGPGGMYTELGRSCVVGTKAPQAMKDELEFVQAGAQVHARPAQARHAVQGHLGRLQRLHAARTAARRKRGSIATARATIWSSGRWCATTSR